MKITFPLFSLCLAFFCCQNQLISGSNVGGYAGTVAITVGDASSSVATPSYKVVSAGLANEAIYTGVISDVNATAITFEVNSSTDSDGDEDLIVNNGHISYLCCNSVLCWLSPIQQRMVEID